MVRLVGLCLSFLWLPVLALAQSVSGPGSATRYEYNRYLDPVIVRYGDLAYALVEEAALSAGLARPFLEGPTSTGSMWQAAARAVSADSALNSGLMGELAALLETPRGRIDYSLAVAPSIGFNQARPAVPLTSEKPYFIHHLEMTEALERLPFLDTRFLFRNGHLALDLNPELRPASHVYWEDAGFWSNGAVLFRPGRIDPNVPYRGLASILLQDFEFRIGRDKLQLGPGRRSSQGLGYNLPWADYASARASFGPVDISWYLVRLDPRISSEEEEYLLSLQDLSEPGLEDKPSYAGLQPVEKAKHLVAGRISWRPDHWLGLALTQYHLVGGRNLQLSDANPLIIFHSHFQEGIYSVPVTLEFSVVPAKGLEFYGQYMLYDATIADEVGGDAGNAGASGWQLGLTALSTPWFDPGPGRLRLDLELNRADPWMYGKYTSWRQFTSRFIFTESFSGRYWVDFPIGFHLGPDAWELWSRLSYGKPGHWDLALETVYSVQGSIDLLGFGTANDYATKTEFSKKDAWVLVREDEAAQRTLRAGLSFQWNPAKGPALQASTALILVEGYAFQPGASRSWTETSCTVKWRL